MPETIHNKNMDHDITEPCGLGRRLMVMVYDAIVLIAIMMAVTAFLLLTPLRDQSAMIDPAPTLIMILTWYLYLALCWKKGLTLGMRSWRVRLVPDDSTPVGWGRSATRFVVSLLSAGCLGLGFFWSLFHPEQKTWHDLASKSRLVRTKK